ncbi:hypothetical protein ASF48_04020 [Rathayibacter sp. Leaf299]|uniref:hypothetical protein n=1 Tax=unclassified Rathayibacter TaxID=2609250 RepID=UPI0006F95250|nr:MULTISPECIES: hypothetical protein [unclassified Rathayibacter]KQQ22377.1 hypothetical protein ASF48_04020 [Rathayibacter sp. Leaf299]
MQTTDQPDGSMVVTVLGSDGRVHQRNSAADGTTFPATWNSYATPGVTDIAISPVSADTRIGEPVPTTPHQPR